MKLVLALIEDYAQLMLHKNAEKSISTLVLIIKPSLLWTIKRLKSKRAIRSDCLAELNSPSICSSDIKG